MEFRSLIGTKKGLCCFVFISTLAQLHAVISHQCFAASPQTYQSVIVPFKPTQNDAFYRPHQLVTVELHKDNLLPAMPTTFLFDTGSTHCAISATLAAKLNLPLHPLMDRLGNPLKLDGKTMVGITVEQLDIGAFQVRDVPINILPDEQLTQALGQPVDGIIGADIWKSLVVQLDFTKNKLTFVISKNPVTYSELASTSTNLTPQDIAQLGFGKSLVVPLLHDPYTYSALFEMTNGTKTETQSLLIDTGTPTTAISNPVSDLLGLEPAVQATYTAMKNFSVNISWLPSIHCGDLNLGDLLVASPRDYARGFVPRLGLDVLANYNILLDFPHQEMYLKPRSDLQSVTSRQYEAASSVQRWQWSQKKLIVAYPTTSGNYGFAIPYDLSSDGLPLAQVKPDAVTPAAPFLLRSSTPNVNISEALAKQWNICAQTVLDAFGKPRMLGGYPVRLATLSGLQLGGALVHTQLGVLPAARLAPYTSYLSVQGVFGANYFFAQPILMDPTSRTWIALTGLRLEDLPSLGMADAAVLDILDPDGDGIPAIAVREQQSAVQFTDTMTLATGSPFTLLSAEAAKTLKLTPEPTKLRYGAGKDIMVFNRAHLSQLSIGGVVLKDVEVAYPIGAIPDGFYPRLGMNVISKLRLLVDAPAKKMYVKTAGK